MRAAGGMLDRTGLRDHLFGRSFVRMIPFMAGPSRLWPIVATTDGGAYLEETKRAGLRRNLFFFSVAFVNKKSGARSALAAPC